MNIQERRDGDNNLVMVLQLQNPGHWVGGSLLLRSA